jgi:hypothetical protein
MTNLVTGCLINVRCCSHGAMSPCLIDNDVAKAPRHSEAATTL